MKQIQNNLEITSPKLDLKTTGLYWSPDPSNTHPPLLALHGWLDNAASFSLLAPLLAEHRIIALDFFGHGHSDHLSKDAVYHMFIYVQQIYDVMLQLQLKEVHFVAHSMGGGVACLFAAMFPQMVKSLVLIESL